VRQKYIYICNCVFPVTSCICFDENVRSTRPEREDAHLSDLFILFTALHSVRFALHFYLMTEKIQTVMDHSDNYVT
jgi:hypothetical protein